MPKNKVKQARQLRELSQEQLATMLNVSRKTINQIESGEANPSINLCISIANLLGKTLDEIFGDELICLNANSETQLHERQQQYTSK